MELTMDNAVEYTEYMLREYYHLNAEPFFSTLDSDVMWIGPGNLFVFGAAAVKNHFKDGFVMPCIEIADAEFYRLQAGKNTCIVAGRFTCCSGQDAKMIVADNQRMRDRASVPGEFLQASSGLSDQLRICRFHGALPRHIDYGHDHSDS